MNRLTLILATCLAVAYAGSTGCGGGGCGGGNGRRLAGNGGDPWRRANGRNVVVDPWVGGRSSITTGDPWVGPVTQTVGRIGGNNDPWRTAGNRFTGRRATSFNTNNGLGSDPWRRATAFRGRQVNAFNNNNGLGTSDPWVGTTLSRGRQGTTLAVTTEPWPGTNTQNSFGGLFNPVTGTVFRGRQGNAFNTNNGLAGNDPWVNNPFSGRQVTAFNANNGRRTDPWNGATTFRGRQATAVTSDPWKGATAFRGRQATAVTSDPWPGTGRQLVNNNVPQICQDLPTGCGRRANDVRELCINGVNDAGTFLTSSSSTLSKYVSEVIRCVTNDLGGNSRGITCPNLENNVEYVLFKNGDGSRNCLNRNKSLCDASTESAFRNLINTFNDKDFKLNLLTAVDYVTGYC